MIRVVAWNIELGCRIEEAADEIAANDDLRPADIVLAQELAPEHAARLGDLLGMNHHYWAPATHPKTGRPFGNAVLSPWPLTSARCLPLPHVAPMNGQARGASVATVDIDGRSVVAYSVHLETVLLRLRRRIEQLGPLVDDIADIAGAPTPAMIMAGDFNSASARTMAALDGRLATVGLQPVSDRSSGTFRRFGRVYTLDHIYARGLQPVSAGVGRASIASDHQPIWVELEPT